jgi:Uma2 family endonuclease
MVAVINDPDLFRTMLRRRRALGLDKYDEVWEGTYVMNAMPNDNHQLIVSRINAVLEVLIGMTGLGQVRPGVNVSDRWDDWKSNYRCPDVLVFLNGNPAANRETHWFGGPDFAVEVLSPRDRARKKLSFYAKVGTREVLLVDRNPWQLELYRLHEGELRLAGTCNPQSATELTSETVPLRFGWQPAEPRPTLVMTHQTDGRVWTA